MTGPAFNATKTELRIIRDIARRASAIYLKHDIERDFMDIVLDLNATHSNGCRLDLSRMQEADDFNLMHDVSGISRHLDRDTGQLTDCFSPRFSTRVFA